MSAFVRVISDQLSNKTLLLFVLNCDLLTFFQVTILGSHIKSKHTKYMQQERGEGRGLSIHECLVPFGPVIHGLLWY